MIQFLIDCRPHSVSMGNAIKFLRHKITKLSPDLPERKAKEDLLEAVEAYVTIATERRGGECGGVLSSHHSII